MNGQRWQMWGYFDDAVAVYQPDPSRSAQVVKDTLGEDFAGVVGTDFYAAYDFLSRTQLCLVHLIRDVRKELESLPKNGYLKRLESGTGKLIRIAREMAAAKLPRHRREQKAEQARKLLDSMLAARPPNKKPCQTLAKRLKRYEGSLLTFLDAPFLGCHNNHAERQLRPVVLFRKASSGNRTEKGAQRYGATATVVETARL
jgi:transposase